ncbi:MAG: 30S ribosomal protein S9 [Chloroflexi bacterium]|nr:30S ribosomal protein S9 [Chloroflexota bacterium]
MANQQQYYYGTGRRKTAIAQVRLYSDGGGGIVINGKPLEEALPWFAWQKVVQQPLQVTDSGGKFHVVAKTQGGGVAAQAGAVRHGIARALVAFDPALKPLLRKYGLMTRDPRVKERKKYGLKRARRAPQYTKR